MTVVLDTREQLAAPRRLRAVPPVAVQSTTLPATLQHVPDSDVEASSVTQARQLAERFPASSTALARLAQAELATGDDDAAIAAARAALRRNGGRYDPSAAVAAAVVLVGAGVGDEAEQALTKAGLADGPLAAVFASLAAERGSFEEALSRLGDLDTADAWSLRGWVSLERKEFAQAVHCYREVLRRAGPSPATLTNLGFAHAALGHRGRGISETQQALGLGPSLRMRVGFNLAWFHLTGGDADRALSILGDLRKTYPHDVEPVFAEAQVQLSLGDAGRALRALRRARTSLWAYLGPVAQAELTANVAFVRWHLGELRSDEAANELIKQLGAIGWKSPRIASMLPPLLMRFSEVERVRRVVSNVLRSDADERPYALEAHLALLEKRFVDAAELSATWAESAIFDPAAATNATFLLCDASGDYERAARLGLDALTRMPAAAILRNNVAYALALCGRTSEAARLAEDLPRQPQHLATQGLVLLRAGRVSDASDRYRDAYEIARSLDDFDLQALVALHALMAFSEFANEAEMPFAVDELQSHPRWNDDPRFAITFELLNRLEIASPIPESPKGPNSQQV